MESEDFEFEEYMILESMGLSLHRFDFVIGSFEWAVEDWVVVPGEDALGMES